jgi:single-stranded-DNA-specific exonuclease
MPQQAHRTHWQVRQPPSLVTIHELSQALQVPPLVAHVLAARGFDESKLRFLEPPLQLTEIPDLYRAAESLASALRQKRRILIHGDYDADGISGTALLTLGLRALGGNVIPYIPDRLSDGYGIHPDRVSEHAARAELFLTVDCGITNLAEIRALQAAGVEVIISDHHTPGQTLPECLIVHPRMSPLARQGLPELTGAGVAFHLLWALHQHLGLEAPLEYSDIATLGTIADVAPLLGENRALICEGLTRLASSRWPGIRAMVAQSRLKGDISARDVAFVLAPRLNAAGRLGEADAGLELLMTSSERRARELAVYLDARNAERKKVQDAMFDEALQVADADAPALVLASDGWHPGVMGIVASKLLERFYKPVFIIAQGKGSVRSTPGISAVQALNHAAAWLKRFGGHSQAAGFAIESGNIAPFRSAIHEFALQHPRPERVVTADAMIAGFEIDDDLYKAIQGLEPFGEGHAHPAFLLAERLDMARAVGASGTTLQLRLGGVKGVGWQMGERAAHLPVGKEVHAVVQLQENTWNNTRSIEFIAEDVRMAERCDLTSTAHDARIRRGKPDTQAIRVTQQNCSAFEVPDSRTPLHVMSVPLATELCATTPLKQVLSRVNPIFFDLQEATLDAALARAIQLPNLADVRRGVVALQRGLGLPFKADKNVIIGQILEELELLGAGGRILRGAKRNPYTSATLQQSLLERHAITTFVLAYRHLSDAAFAESITRLFSADYMT